MNTHQIASDASVAAAPEARIGASHGYRFDGDSVHLTASFRAQANADFDRVWSLRLVATPTAPTAPADAAAVLAGHVVADVALPPISELTGAVDNFETVAAAIAPASRGFHLLSLALIARGASGRVVIHDYVTYSLAQAFAQPRLTGPVGLWFESDSELVLDLDLVENPREPANQSGTLSVEVWALDHAYAGGSFAGQPIAGATLGSLAGGDSWTPGPLYLTADRRGQEGSHLVVMLREWNGSGYVTRDYVNFAPRAVTAPESATVAAPAVAPVTRARAKASVSAQKAPKAAATIGSVVKATKGRTVAPKVASAARVAKDGRISINTGTVAELTTIKGLSAKLAEAMIAARPLARMEDLRFVKGFTPKTLEKIQPYLKA